MKINILVLIVYLFLPLYLKSQDITSYNGNWEGELRSSKTFNFRVEIENLGLENTVFQISNDDFKAKFPFKLDEHNQIFIPFTEKEYFRGLLSKNKKEISGFIRSGMLLYHLNLQKVNKNNYLGTWNIFFIDELKSQKLFLNVETNADSSFGAYPFLSDNRFTGTWCHNFKKENNEITFTDGKTGIHFKGKLLFDKIHLGLYFGNHLIADIDLTRSKSDWQFGGFASDLKSTILQLREMELDIVNDTFPNTHAVLISKNGKLIYENYFDGYNPNIPHDTRSASKSISSAIVGIAKDKSLFTSVDQSIFDLLPLKYETFKDSLKSKIDIKSLLTMSSGIDAIDFGIERTSLASEDMYQQTEDWTKTILEAPMIYKPNTRANYGSANPHLLGVAMGSIVKKPLELFIDQNLFEKLNITNYILQTDLTERPYFGGGMYLTPRDMMKFGELYLNNGAWKGKQVISKEWINLSFKNYRTLENTKDKNGYGYFWWHKSYELDEKKIASIEARGAGGQYIFIIPTLKTVVVIMSGNFRNGKTQQPEAIFHEKILPALLK